MIDGGQVAARGFHFQYLASVDRLLDMLTAGSEIAAVHIESSGGTGDPADDQTVDLATRNARGDLLSLIQIKSVEHPETGKKLGAKEVVAIAASLARDERPHRYEIVTNRDLASATRDLIAAVGRNASIDELARYADTVTELDAAELWALRSTIIVSVDSTTGDYRRVVQDRIRTHRIANRDGTGIDSSGIMTAYLVDNVFQAAAGITERNIARDTAARWLGTRPAVIAALLDDYDWGNTIGTWPPLPQLTRTRLLDRLASNLETTGPRARSTDVVAVRGLSGSGKSSLVAHFAYLHAYDYAFMAWVDCESIDTIRVGFARLLSALDSDVNVDPEHIEPSAASEWLSRRPGRWLLVLDNVADVRTIEPWIPSRGDGQIILTTVDSGAFADLAPVDVGKLDRDESIDLIRSRITAAPRVDADDKLSKLADELGDWPLALSMAAAFIDAASVDLNSAVDDYLYRLAERVVDDEPSIPRDYPRTLTAAILLAIDALAEIGADYPEGTFKLSVSALFTGAFLAETDIPVQLLIAATLVSPEELERRGLQGPVELVDTDTQIDDVVRLLRRRSFIWRHHIVASDEYDKFMADRVSMNTITQLVLRAKCHRDNSVHGVATILNRSAYHVNRWLQHMMDNERFVRTVALTPHAERVVTHAQSAGLASMWCALLSGNLALAYRTLGLYARARDVLQYEILQLNAMVREISEMKPPYVLAAKAGLQLLEAQINCGDSMEELRQVAALTVGAVIAAAETGHAPELIATIAENVDMLLDQEGDPADPLTDLRTRLATILPSQPGFVATSREISRLIGIGDDHRAITLARTALSTPVPMPGPIQLHGQLAEAHAYLGDFEESLRELRNMMDKINPPSIFPTVVLDQLNNIGLAASNHTDQAAALTLLRTTLALAGPRLDATDDKTRTMHEKLVRQADDHAE